MLATFPSNPMHKTDIGVMAYNEEENIGHLLTSILSQKLVYGELNEVLVVASGCSDKTEEVVKRVAESDKRVRLLVQPRREGKASAINLFISEASGEFLILESGDTIPEEGTIDKLLAPFVHQQVGMTGGHPVPLNSKNCFIGYTVNLMWNLHHVVSLTTPKMGELVAFRNIVKRIPEHTAVDEASIEKIVKEAGYQIRYVADAIVYNKGPETVGEFIKQRRRISAGHRHLLKETGYRVSTLSPVRLFRELLQLHTWGLKETIWTLGAIGLEAIGRLLGWWDFCVRKRTPYMWPIAKSTKRLISGGRR